MPSYVIGPLPSRWRPHDQASETNEPSFIRQA
jgi:hypothetical protein